MMTLSVATVCTMVMAVGQTSDIPNLHPWLAKVIADRSGQTARVDFKAESHYSVNEGRVEYYTTQTMGDSFYQSRDDWDPPGVTNYADSETPGRAPPRSTELISWEGNWLHSEQSTRQRESRISRGEGWPTSGARLIGRYMRPDRRDPYQGIDPRVLGLGPDIGRGPGILGPLAVYTENELDGVTWTESTDGMNDILRAQVDEKHSLVWYFSNEQGHQPTQVEWLVGDHLLKHSETELQQVDGRWIPKTVRVIEHYQNPTSEPLVSVTVTDASFDKPWHRQEPFSPEDIGVVFGTEVIAYTSATGLAAGSWNGFEFVPWEDIFDLQLGWGLDYHPDLAKRLWASVGGQEAYEAQLAKQRKAYLEQYEAKHGEPHPSLLVVKQADEQDEWDLYVAEFIAEHKLDEPRVERAHDLLGRAKKLRGHYRRKNKADQRKAEEEGDSAKLERIAAIEQRIFDRVLKRGLGKLLPRKERPHAGDN